MMGICQGDGSFRPDSAEWGAQPLAATMAGACFLGVEADRSRIEKRLQTKYLDEICDNLDEALKRLEKGVEK